MHFKFCVSAINFPSDTVPYKAVNISNYYLRRIKGSTQWSDSSSRYGTEPMGDHQPSGAAAPEVGTVITGEKGRFYPILSNGTSHLSLGN